MLSDRSKRNFQFIKQGKGFGGVCLCADFFIPGIRSGPSILIINRIKCEITLPIFECLSTKWRDIKKLMGQLRILSGKKIEQ
ncbi:MAG: hypothetical protein CVU10_07685 [Bacteroidetes bacterium HGW-Bacteroidetes-5]|nr:MAG: hypothetical protein CVU10_07685 [Bacteroidetes bacterium HGW-Bacteroidetes-5]